MIMIRFTLKIAVLDDRLLNLLDVFVQICLLLPWFLCSVQWLEIVLNGINSDIICEA